MSSRELLVLYSWEEDTIRSQKWAMAFCVELMRYKGVNASCDLLWAPNSDVKQEIRQRIENADNIIVIVTKSYNQKIEAHTGMVSYEAAIYAEVIKKSSDKNKILFIQKEEGISLPLEWEAYNRFDLSILNPDKFFLVKDIERRHKIDEVIRFCFNIPAYEISIENTLQLPTSNQVQSYEQWYSNEIYEEIFNDDEELTEEEQEQRLVDFIAKNADQVSFVELYIRSGLSADSNLNKRMTPQLFKKYFLVNRENREEHLYDSVINELFTSPNFNCLCIQSDGGSGKSVFIQTMCTRKKDGDKQRYTNILFDLSTLTSSDNTKELLLFQRVRKIYNAMSRGKGAYYEIWRELFKKITEELETTVFADENISSLHSIQKDLLDTIQHLVPEKAEDWYKGYSQRISQAKNVDSSTLFTVLMILYLIILDCKPQIKKPERFVIVFDNLETYDNGRIALRISNYIETCYRYLTSVFSELGRIDGFYKKFTFVIVLRTSTLIPFASLQSNMYASTRFVKRLKFFDFTEEALLKKLKFLKKIPNYRCTKLFNMLYTIISIMLPTKNIDEYLEKGIITSPRHRYFTSQRLLPLFNNNYRQTMQNIFGSITNEDEQPTLYAKIVALKGMEGSIYDYSVNGIRMTLIRDVFNRLRIHSYFDEIGFSELGGNRTYSMTRMVLGYLYWDEVQHVLKEDSFPYGGVELSRIANTFKYFCKSSELVEILYGLSIYSKRNYQKSVALNEWANLIIFENIDIDLTETEFCNIIMQYLAGNDVHIHVDNIEINIRNITIRLSDAGLCFTQYYIRSFEFLMSRSKNASSSPSLFMLDDSKAINSCLCDIYEIICNCIDKLIYGCEHMCVLYGKEKKECVLCKPVQTGFDLNVMSCSLFIRYQECLDLIREAINYIDRYRVVINYRLNDEEINSMLLKQIKMYYELYDRANQALKAHTYTVDLISFMEYWKYPNNIAINTKLNRCLQNSERIQRSRPLQAYYIRSDENIDNAIEQATRQPTKRLHSIIHEQLGSDRYEEV